MDLAVKLEKRMTDLRAALREARRAGDRARVAELDAELREVEEKWDAATAPPGARSAPSVVQSLVPFREQVHHALTLLTVPAAPRLIATVHEAFFGADLPSQRFTSLRRDEEKSYSSAPMARPYYLCPALTADRLAPVRALLSISTWAVADRMVGPLSPRVHFLTSAIRVAEAVQRLPERRPEAQRLLMRFAANIPGGSDDVISAARAELVIHEETDRATRQSAARRAARLNERDRLFGVKLVEVRVEDAV